MKEALSEISSGTAQINLAGICGGGTIEFGTAFDFQGCLVYDGESVYDVWVGSAGGGAIYAGASAGLLASNAERAPDLRGPTVCLGGGAAHVSGEICLGYKDGAGFTGFWTAYGGAGPSLPAGPLSAHITVGVTFAHKLFSLPCLNGPNLPDLFATPWFDLPDLWDIGSVGCG